MTFWYNAPKDTNKFATLNCSDYENTAFYAKFSELRIQRDKDDHFILFGHCLKAGDVKKKDAEPSWRLTDADTQLPIMIAYSLMPSAMASTVPILFLNGGKGSGKSTAMKIIGAIHDQQLLSASTSAAALRNHINASRWDFPDELEGEKNTLILFDNLTMATFLNEFLYLYFLNGYDRESDKVMISSGFAGTNLNFRVFSPKVISSIHPLLNHPQFEELARRCFPINFKSLDTVINYGDIPALTSLDMLDLSNLKASFDQFWYNIDHLKTYANTKKRLLKMQRKIGIPDSFTSAQWVISLDILVTGCVLDMWDINGGLAALRRYFAYLAGMGKPTQPPMFLLLKQFTEKEEAIAKELNKGETEINAFEVKTLVYDAAKQGQLDCEVRSSVIGETMRQLGYVLEMNNRKQLAWRKK
jgi:hypothetical protein